MVSALREFSLIESSMCKNNSTKGSKCRDKGKVDLENKSLLQPGFGEGFCKETHFTDKKTTLTEVECS